MSELIYTGIGARDVPDDIGQLQIQIAEAMALKGYKLRSGAADGSDHKFETGCLNVKGVGEIYLPWDGFKGKDRLIPTDNVLYILNHGQEGKAAKILIESGVCDYIDNVQKATYHFFCRNVYQVLGETLDKPSNVVIYYAPEDYLQECMGGTRIAVNLARKRGITTKNLLHEKDREFVKKVLKL